MAIYNIIVVDDSLLTSKKLTAMIHELGHRVVQVCKTGAEAIEEYRFHHPTLVTMDITMPDMDGIAATIGILEHDPKAKVIMVTSHGQEQMVVRALDAGARGYVLKPVKLEKLKAMIEQVMRFG
jgi:two-component system chemotaxis response regulator CheY